MILAFALAIAGAILVSWSSYVAAH